MKKIILLSVTLFTACVLLLACGGSDRPEYAPHPTPDLPPTEAITPTSTPEITQPPTITEKPDSLLRDMSNEEREIGTLIAQAMRLENNITKMTRFGEPPLLLYCRCCSSEVLPESEFATMDEIRAALRDYFTPHRIEVSLMQAEWCNAIGGEPSVRYNSIWEEDGQLHFYSDNWWHYVYWEDAAW